MRDLRRWAYAGAVSALVVIYLCLVGIVLAFAERNVITGVLTLGRIMMAVPPLVAGYVVARNGTAASRLGGGLVAGTVSGAIVGAGLLFASAVDLRDIFVRLSPPLIDFVAFGQEPAVGAALNVAFAAACGLIGASLQLAPHRVRRFVVAGAVGVLVLSMLEPFLRPRLTEFDLGFISVFLFQQRGLSIPAAILTFLAVGAGTLPWRPARRAVQQRLRQADPGTQSIVRWVSDPRADRPAALPAAAGRAAAEPGAGPGRALRPAGARAQHRGRLRRPARPRVRGLLRGRRLSHRSPHVADLVARLGAPVLGRAADRGRRRRHHRPAHRCPGPAPAR